MPTVRFQALLSTLFLFVAAGAASAVTLARPPDILELRQVGTTVRVLWSPGGDADGTLHEEVDSYTLQRKIGNGSWTTIFTDDDDTGDGALEMQYDDDVDGLYAWGVGPTFNYRVIATTEDSTTTNSTVKALALARLKVEEVLDAKARLDWIASEAPPGYPVHLGYVVQKKGPGFNNWIDITPASPPGMVQDLAYIDPNTTTGSSQYRVRTVYQQAAPGTGTTSSNTNSQQVWIETPCAGQPPNPHPLNVIDIVDGDEDGPDGDDIAAALSACEYEAYEDFSGPGDDDGVWEEGELPIFGGCILRAGPVTYENVALRITSRPSCNDDASPTNPLQCVPANYPAGLVFEGHGSRTVFRSPLWGSLGSPAPLPAPVLEVHRHDIRVTVRNLVLDGRKFEQVPPGEGNWSGWWFAGLVVWNSGPWGDQVRPIPGGLLGDGDNFCDFEVCAEDGAAGPTTHDGDGKCEAGETCLEVNSADGGDNDGVCDSDSWTTAVACESTKDADYGCIHNVEVRDMAAAFGVAITHANGWVIEDSEFHDVGCVNRGYGYDCPHFASAADVEVGGVVPITGFKTFGIGLHVGEYTADFQVRRNHAYRVTKYGLSFKNQSAIDCNGLLRNHEVWSNVIHDVGAVGIYNHGTVGARIHDNTISKSTTWDERDNWVTPPVTNGHDGPYGMSLGGFCSDDNEFIDNDILEVAGPAILWHGDTQTVECSGGDCDPVTPVGNTIANNVIDGTCQEKVTAAGTTNTFGAGSIYLAHGAGGTLHLTDNVLTGSECRFAISAYGASTGISPLDARISGGSYESGPNVATSAQGGFYSGPVHVHGSNRKLVIGDDTEIINTTTSTIPKATVGYGATLVIDDVPADPFADGPYSSAADVGGGGLTATIVQCSVTPSHPDCD